MRTVPDWRPHFERASELLAADDPTEYRHAALELRLAIEALTYEKAEGFRRHLPASFFETTWQPPHILKRLKQVDDIADRSFTLRMGDVIVEDQPQAPNSWQTIGNHHALTAAWLSKNYRALGSLLHLPVFGGKAELGEMRSRLLAIAGEISAAGASTIRSMSMAQIVSATCEICAGPICASVPWVQAQGLAQCLNPKCEAEYFAELIEDGARFSLRAYTHTCKCGQSLQLELRKLQDGLEVSCAACRQRYRVNQSWNIGRLVEPADARESESPAAG